MTAVDSRTSWCVERRGTLFGARGRCQRPHGQVPVLQKNEIRGCRNDVEIQLRRCSAARADQTARAMIRPPLGWPFRCRLTNVNPRWPQDQHHRPGPSWQPRPVVPRGLRRRQATRSTNAERRKGGKLSSTLREIHPSPLHGARKSQLVLELRLREEGPGRLRHERART